MKDRSVECGPRLTFNVNSDTPPPKHKIRVRSMTTTGTSLERIPIHSVKAVKPSCIMAEENWSARRKNCRTRPSDANPVPTSQHGGMRNRLKVFILQIPRNTHFLFNFLCHLVDNADPSSRHRKTKCNHMKWMSFCCLTNRYWSSSKMTSILTNRYWSSSKMTSISYITTILNTRQNANTFSHCTV